MSGSLAGAVITTFLAPACRCLEDVALSRKIPVDSTTMSAARSPHGSVAGSLAEQTRISRPLTKMASPLAITSASSVPCTESCLSRWARVFASARSLTATTSMSGVSSAARKNTRPIRPNPFTPTRTAIAVSFPVYRGLIGTSSPSRGVGHYTSDGARDDQHADRRRAAVAEAARARHDGRSRREHVVHQRHVPSRHLRAPAQRERAPDVVSSSVGGQLGLRQSRAGPRESVRARDAPRPAEAVRQEPSLIEAALAF